MRQKITSTLDYLRIVMPPSALGGGLGRPRRWGIPSPEGERKCSDGGIRFRRDETVDI